MFDAESFQKDLDKNREAFSSIDCVDVKCVVRKQCGFDILVGRCPRCHVSMAVDAEGKQMCRHCGQFLNFRADVDGR
jgi:hypothetical protein